MKRILPLLILGAPLAVATDPTVGLTALRGHLYVAEDNFYLKENSMVYVGDNFVTTKSRLFCYLAVVFSRSRRSSRQTPTTASATRIPSETSAKRCAAAIHGVSARGIITMIASVMQA
jgi:hypothetical protein